MEWKRIKGFENYEINAFGDVRNTLRNNRLLTPKVIQNRKVKNAQPRVQVRLNRDKVQYHFYVHRLVLQAFEPTNDGDLEVNHIDGDPLNNHLSNLEWCTKRDNLLHAYQNGLKSGTKMMTVLCKEGITYQFDSVVEASKFIGCKHSSISTAKKRNTQIYGYTVVS